MTVVVLRVHSIHVRFLASTQDRDECLARLQTWRSVLRKWTCGLLGNKSAPLFRGQHPIYVRIPLKATPPDKSILYTRSPRVEWHYPMLFQKYQRLRIILSGQMCAVIFTRKIERECCGAKVEPAPHPEDIVWENLSFSKGKRLSVQVRR